MTEIEFKKIFPEARLPSYAHRSDAGFDLFSIENYQLRPGERYLFGTGIKSKIPRGYCVIIKPKSGLAVRAGIDVLAGVIDSGYRGEWQVLLINLGNKPYHFRKGDKIAQGLLIQVGKAKITRAEWLSASTRGEDGFGSTGK